MQVSRVLLHPAAKPVLFGAALLPFAWLLVVVAGGALLSLLLAYAGTKLVLI